MLFLDHESPRPVSTETIRLMHEIVKSMQTRLKSSGVALTAVVIPSYEQAQLQATVTHELNLRTVHILNELGVLLSISLKPFATIRSTIPRRTITLALLVIGLWRQLSLLTA